MALSAQKNGPASVAADPDLGLNLPQQGNPDMDSNITAEPEGQTETRDVGDAIDILVRALNVSELIFMAGNGMWHDHNKAEGEAIMVGVDLLRDMVIDAKSILHANLGEVAAS